MWDTPLSLLFCQVFKLYSVYLLKMLFADDSFYETLKIITSNKYNVINRREAKESLDI